MTGAFNYILMVAAILSFAVYPIPPATPDDLYLGVILVGIVIATGSFSFY